MSGTCLSRSSRSIVNDHDYSDLTPRTKKRVRKLFNSEKNMVAISAKFNMLVSDPGSQNKKVLNLIRHFCPV